MSLRTSPTLSPHRLRVRFELPVPTSSRAIKEEEPVPAARAPSRIVNAVARIVWVDRLPAWAWLACAVVALTPVWLWSAARLLDGSDDPLGIVALIALVMLIARDRDRFSESPRIGWLALATVLAAAAVIGAAWLPPLIRGVLAVLAVCAMLLAVRNLTQPLLALSGLALLALPLLSSLQFFVGYPLRVVTAEASAWLLALFGVAVERNGSALEVAGRLVMVDAPCSGIQMAWIAYFTACAAAAWLRTPDARFFRRVPLVGVTVLAGNIVRNTLLVVKEAELAQWPEWTHDVIGLATFAAVCALVLWYIARAGGTQLISWEVRLLTRSAPAVTVGTWARLLVLVSLSVVTLWPRLQPAPVMASMAAAVEWPREFEGRPLRPLALTAVEQRFAERFPGAIARFSDGEGAVVLRHVTAPTRMLHPATDCYRGVGYRVLSTALEQETDKRTGAVPKLWRCVVAERNGQRVRVCEHIVDARGRTFTDTSAWYWAAVMGRSEGPWRAVTKARVFSASGPSFDARTISD